MLTALGLGAWGVAEGFSVSFCDEKGESVEVCQGVDEAWGPVAMLLLSGEGVDRTLPEY